MRLIPVATLGRLTIGRKLLISFGLLLAVLVLSLAGLLLYLSRVNGYVDRHQRNTVPGVVTAAEMQQKIARMSFLFHHALDHSVDSAYTGVIEQLHSLAGQFKTALDVYREQHATRTHPVLYGMLVSHGRKELADQEDLALSAIAVGLDRLEAARTQVAARLHAVWSGAQREALETQVDHTVADLEGSLATLIEIHRKIDVEMKLEGDRLVKEAQGAALAFIVILGLLIVLTYAAVHVMVVRPLTHLAVTADRVARHDLTVHFDPWPSSDEVGRLAASLGTMLANLRDRTAALMHKTKELEAFTYSIAHDLKGPLREIEGFSSLLEKRFAEGAEPEVRHHLEVIHRSALRLTSMIDSLLKYSRLEQQRLPMSRFNLVEMVGHLVAERSQVWMGRTPKIVTELPFSDLYGEPVSVRQALQNLLDNAIKFSRRTLNPEIDLGGKRIPGETILWVKDNGIGIDQKDQERIFGLFERLRTSSDDEGTGVGLAIVKLVMEKHGGRVWLDSTPGKGSTFYLAFPEHAA